MAPQGGVSLGKKPMTLGLDDADIRSSSRKMVWIACQQADAAWRQAKK